MLSSIGISDLLVILIVVLILFAPSKLSELGRALGQALTEFKKTARELTRNTEEEKKKRDKADISANATVRTEETVIRGSTGKIGSDV